MAYRTSVSFGGELVTSEERREARFQRRKQRRERKKAEFRTAFDHFNVVFSYENLYRSYRLCRRGVAWKASTQKYISKAPLNVYRTCRQLQNGTFRSKGFAEFDIVERGKKRHIRSVDMYERVVQRCLCDHALTPVIGRSFIYDNGATMRNKGYSFTVRRLVRHLQGHYRKYGSEGYILLYDFKSFFDSIPHDLVKDILRNAFSDQRLLCLADRLIDAFGEAGLGLGSQISQIMALSSANRVDHYCKEVLRIRGYGRYMDDGYLIHPSKEYLKECLRQLQLLCDQLGLRLNPKKTRIVKLSHGFTFMKVRIFLTPSGKVVKKLSRTNITRTRRKLKALGCMVSRGELTLDDVYASFQSWRAYAKTFNAHRAIQNMEAVIISAPDRTPSYGS